MNLNVTEEKKNQIKSIISQDPELRTVKSFVQNGWPNKVRECPEHVKFYYKHRSEITECDDLLFKGKNLIVPKALRKEILQKLHYTHLGVKKCVERAYLSFYWPGMRKQIEDTVLSCQVCQSRQKSQSSEPMISHDIPRLPWYKLGADIFHLYNESYLLLIDYYSKYVEIVNLNRDLTSCNVIHKLKSIFSRFGIPKILCSDNGPEFSSMEFKNFCKAYDFQHITSSPIHPQSNGQVERAIQTVKDILRKCSIDKKDPYLALLEFRNMPIDGENSPANILMNRNLRSILPLTNHNFQQKCFNKSKYDKFVRNAQIKQKQYFKKRGTKHLEELKNNDSVKVQVKSKGPWDNGKVIKKINIRSYLIKLESGRTIRRNRKHIKKLRCGKEIEPTKGNYSDSSQNYTNFETWNNFSNYYNVIKVVEPEDEESGSRSRGNLDEGNMRSDVNSSLSSSDSNFLDCEFDSVKQNHVTKNVVSSQDNNFKENREESTRTKSGRLVRKPKKYVDFSTYSFSTDYED